MSNDDDEQAPSGFVLIPAGSQEAHVRHRMEAQDRVAAAQRLIDGLLPDQLVALRWILNQDQDSAMNNFWDGQVVATLRLVHGADPITGLTPLQTLEQAEARP